MRNFIIAFTVALCVDLLTHVALTRLITPAAPAVLTPRQYVPLVTMPVKQYPLKGVAGCYTDGASYILDIDVCSNWYRAYTVPPAYLVGYNIVPKIQHRTTDFRTPFVVDYVGQNWYLLNEPDYFGNPNTSDGVTPTLGAEILFTVAERIQPQGARIICCDTLFGGAWLEDVFSEYTLRYDGDARQRIWGYGFSIYAILGAPCGDEACIAQHFEWQVDRALAWVEAHDPGKPVLLTEWGWTPIQENNWTDSIRHLRLLCPIVNSKPLYAHQFYVGTFPTWDLNQRYMSLVLEDKSISPLGVVFRDEC